MFLSIKYRNSSSCFLVCNTLGNNLKKKGFGIRCLEEEVMPLKEL